MTKTWLSFEIWSNISTNTVLSVLYIYVIIKLKKARGVGSVLTIAYLLLTASFLNLCDGLASVFIMRNRESHTISWFAASILGWRVGFFFFGVGHWLLAVLYLDLATNMPE